MARRVWRGQVSVLFPFVEERRQDVIEILRNSLEIPYLKMRPGSATPNVITKVERLEIGDVLRQLAAQGRSDSTELGRLVRSLTQIRNKLAHFAETNMPLDASALRSPEMRDWAGILRRFASAHHIVVAAMVATA